MPDTDGRTFHFWFDCETTGLDVGNVHVLEIGWTVTDDEFRMLTPLRQRFVNIGNHGSFDGKWAALNDLVHLMHVDSGLAEAWDTAPELGKITDPQSMNRLFLDDLVTAGFCPNNTEERKADKLVLSGAGVSHFDNRVLYTHLPFFYPREIGIYNGIWAYWRTFDTSTLWRGIGEKYMKDIRAKAFDPDTDVPWSILACEKPGHPGEGAEVAHLMFHDGSSNEFRFDPNAVVKHRAADDVVESLLIARAVRALPHLELS